MSAQRRTDRDRRRRSLGQNFLQPEAAERFVAGAGVRPHELVLDIGAGSGAVTLALARRGAEILAIERDPVWADRLRGRCERRELRSVEVRTGDFREAPLPTRPFRVVSSLPFGATTDILRRLLDDPEVPLQRADVVLQWEVARKRAQSPPATLLSTRWAPWWEFRLGQRIGRRHFRPVPAVDAGVLVITRRSPPILPARLARPYGQFLNTGWPFESGRGA